MGPYQSQQEMDFGGRYSSGSQKMQIGRESGKWGDQTLQIVMGNREDKMRQMQSVKQISGLRRII